MSKNTDTRLAEIRKAIEAENVSMGELIELQNLADYIDPDDMLLLEWAGVPEHEEVDTEENWIIVEFSDGTKATIVVDDDTADNIAGAIERMTGLRMNVST